MLFTSDKVPNMKHKKISFFLLLRKSHMNPFRWWNLVWMKIWTSRELSCCHKFDYDISWAKRETDEDFFFARFEGDEGSSCGWMCVHTHHTLNSKWRMTDFFQHESVLFLDFVVFKYLYLCLEMLFWRVPCSCLGKDGMVPACAGVNRLVNSTTPD